MKIMVIALILSVITIPLQMMGCDGEPISIDGAKKPIIGTDTSEPLCSIVLGDEKNEKGQLLNIKVRFNPESRISAQCLCGNWFTDGTAYKAIWWRNGEFWTSQENIWYQNDHPNKGSISLEAPILFNGLLETGEYRLDLWVDNKPQSKKFWIE